MGSGFGQLRKHVENRVSGMALIENKLQYAVAVAELHMKAT